MDTFDINLPDNDAHSGADLQTPTIHFDLDLDHEGRQIRDTIRKLRQAGAVCEDGVLVSFKNTIWINGSLCPKPGEIVADGHGNLI
jgi:hypothetical protein